MSKVKSSTSPQPLPPKQVIKALKDKILMSSKIVKK